MTEKGSDPLLSERRLLEALAGLPRERAPEHDQWPAISRRIGRTERQGIGGRRAFRWWPQAVAASVALAFVTGMLIGRQWGNPGLTDDAGGWNAPPGEIAGVTDIAATLAASEIEFQAAFREFVTVGRSRNLLPDRAVEHIETGWSDLRDTEAALTAALQQHPGDPFLNSKMIDLRTRQIDFLKQIAMLDRNSRRSMI